MDRLLPLDPLIAIAVAVNIMVVGTQLVWRSGSGLMDSALPAEQRDAIDDVLDRYRADGIVFHDIRTREAGHQRFVQLHMLVPGGTGRYSTPTTSPRSSKAICMPRSPDLNITTHLEPVNDPRAYEDWRLE